jgi:hypothetical protein
VLPFKVDGTLALSTMPFRLAALALLPVVVVVVEVFADVPVALLPFVVVVSPPHPASNAAPARARERVSFRRIKILHCFQNDAGAEM